MATTSCMTTTLTPINNEFSPDPYILASGAPSHLRPFSNDYNPRRQSLPPLVIPAQPTRRPPPIPVKAMNRPRSQTNFSPFSPPLSASTRNNANFVDRFTFQNPCLLPPFLSSTPTTASPSPHNNRPLSCQQTPVEIKAGWQSTSSNRQLERQYLSQPNYQFRVCRSSHDDVTAPVYGREIEPPTNSRQVQSKPEHIKDHVPVSRRRTRLPPRLSDRKLGPPTATSEARQRAALVDLIEAFERAGVVGGGSNNGIGTEDSGSSISVYGRRDSIYYHSGSFEEENLKGFDGTSMEIIVRTGDQGQRLVHLDDGVPEDDDMESEERELMARGLKKVSAEEYCEDIRLLLLMAFDE